MVRGSNMVSCVLAILFCLNPVALSRTFYNTDINVFDYGAKGDGCTDDSQAFSRAWAIACNLPSTESVNIIIPHGWTFLVHPILFRGPCKPSEMNFKIFGTIISPENPKTWDGGDTTQWLAFRSVSGLSVEGNGTIHGRGKNWWSQSCRNYHGKGCTKLAPTAIKFLSCDRSYLRNLNFIDSANTHISIKQCEWFHIFNVRIMAPRSSPNTDGIHIEGSKHVFIDSSDIKSGDDCISIGDHTSDIRITNIFCGPGHGISVGSLGKDQNYVQVRNIHVSNVNFYKTTNGVRIKTWQGATGYARDITFEHLNFTAVQNPIIIDQYYCNRLYIRNCRAGEKSVGGVQISGVTYRNAVGTSSTKVAIKLDCSQNVACTGIILDTIELTSTQHSKRKHERVTSSCFNAHGRTKGLIQPKIPCLALE